MARLWSCGWETGTHCYELGSTYGKLSFDSSVKRSGNYSLCLAPTQNAATYFYKTFTLTQSYTQVYLRYYLLVGTTLNTESLVSATRNQVTAGLSCKVYLTANNTLQLKDGDNNLIGGTSPVLNNSQWYRVESYHSCVSGSLNDLMELRLDGVTVSSTTSGVGQAGITDLQFGSGGTNINGRYYLDDIAFNDTTGSYQNSWPGAGSIINLVPDSQGDSNEWENSDSGINPGVYSSNWTYVNDVPPDILSFIYLSDSEAPCVGKNDLYNVGAMPESITSVNCVQVGFIFWSNTTDLGAPRFRLALMSTSGGVMSTSVQISVDSDSYRAHANQAGVRNYRLTNYLTPENNQWTDSTLDSMQVGVLCTTEATGVGCGIFISELWALVDYNPGQGGVDATYNASAIDIQVLPQTVTLALQYEKVINASEIKIGLVLNQPTIIADKNITISASTIVAQILPQTATVTTAASATITPNAIAVSLLPQAVTISTTGTATISASTLVASILPQAITIATTKQVTISATTTNIEAILQTATISTQRSVTISASVIQASIIPQATTIDTTKTATISASISSSNLISNAVTISTVYNKVITPDVIVAEIKPQVVVVATAGSATIQPSAIVASWVINAVTISTEYSKTISASAINIEGVTNAVTISTTKQVTISATAISASILPQAPTISTAGSATISAGIIEVSILPQASTITTTRSITISASVISAALALQAPAITVSGNISVSANAVKVDIIANVPSITTQKVIEVMANAIDLAFTAPQSTISVQFSVVNSASINNINARVMTPTINPVSATISRLVRKSVIDKELLYESRIKKVWLEEVQG